MPTPLDDSVRIHLRKHPQTFLAAHLADHGLLPAFTFVEAGPALVTGIAKFPQPHFLYWLPEATGHLFEAHPERARKLATQPTQFTTRLHHHTLALGSHINEQAEFYETVHAPSSSLAAPKLEELERWEQGQSLKLHRTVRTGVTDLASWCGRNAVQPDLLVLDINGAELQALEGAEPLLERMLGLRVTCNLVPLYEGQPHWGEVDGWLRARGWQLHHLTQSTSKRLAETEIYTQPQLISITALYLPTSARVEQLDGDRLRLLALLASVHDATDFAEHALKLADEREGVDRWTAFRTAFFERFYPPQLRPQVSKNGTQGTVSESAFVPMVDGVEVSVDGSLLEMTPFILREQGDWFEVELPWVRRWLQPEMRVIDVGANHGIYALAASRRVGENGRVWAVEPTPSLVTHLERSKAHNRFSQLTLCPFALSHSSGEATFYLGAKSELNTLVPQGSESNSITVPTRRLDEWAAEEGVSGIDFIKLDAEGEEVPILAGGEQFFQRESPLVMFEFHHGSHLNWDLVQRLEQLGYGVFRLVPGLGILAPFQTHDAASQQHLNLFAAKPDRAEALAGQGLLSNRVASTQDAELPAGAHHHYLGQFTYGATFTSRMSPDWAAQLPEGELYAKGLDAWCLSRLPKLPAAQRCDLLNQAVRQITKAIEVETTLPRLLTLARATRDWGLQHVARQILGQLAQEVLQGREFQLNEPFVCPSAEFELHTQPVDPVRWLMASIVHAQLEGCAYSFYFLPQWPERELAALERWGYLLPSMERRKALAKHHHSMTSAS